MMHPDWIAPDWPAPNNVHALITTRAGGVSRGPYAAADGGGMNVGFGSGDDPTAVAENRMRLATLLPGEPRWLRQMHGAEVVDAESVQQPVAADAACTLSADVVVAIMVADCMPVLLTDSNGRCVAAAHTGWRGLAAGVLQATVQAMRSRLASAERADADDNALIAYLGPAIGPRHFEVGPEVLAAMQSRLPCAHLAFVDAGNGKFLADLPALARQALAQAGVDRISGGGDCTFSDPHRFYSYRRDRITGRHAALIWRTGDARPV